MGSVASCLLLALLLPDCEPLDKCFPSVAHVSTPRSNTVCLVFPRRADVLVMTPWFAPIIWDGVFDSTILDAQFQNATIGLTVFAIKK